MKTKIERKDDYSLACAENKKSQLAFFTLTVDLSLIISQLNIASPLVFEEAIISGTKEMTREDFQDAVSKLGAKIIVEISNDLLTVSLRATAENYSKSLDLLFKSLTGATFNAKELKRIIRTETNNLEQLKDDSKFAAHANLKRALFNKTNRRYQTDIDELLKKITNVQKKDLVQIQNFLLNSFWYISTAGNKKVIDSGEIRIKKFKASSKIRAPKKRIATALTKKPTLVFSDIPSRQNIDISIGAELPLNLNHPDYPALVMSLAILGKWSGFAGRLMSTVREKEGLTYGIYAKPEGVFQNENCYWRVMTFFAPVKVLAGLTSTFREIKKMHKSGITQSELNKFKTILKTQQELVNDSLAGKASRLHYHHVQNLSLAESEAYFEKIQALTRSEVNNVIKKYLSPKSLTISCAGPVSSVKKDIQSFAKTL